MEIKIAHPTKFLFYFSITQNNTIETNQNRTCTVLICAAIFLHLNELESFHNGKVWLVRNQKSSKVLSDQVFSFLIIARDIKKSRKVISNILQDPETYGTKKSTGHPLKPSPTVCQETPRKGISSRNLKTYLNLNVTPRRVWQILNSSKDFIYKKTIYNTSINKDAQGKMRGVGVGEDTMGCWELVISHLFRWKKVELSLTRWISVLLVWLTKSGTNFQQAPVWRRIFDDMQTIFY